MPDLSLLNDRLIVIIAVIGRIGGFVATGPVFSSRYIPGVVKAAVVLYMGLFLSPMIPVSTPATVQELAWMVCTEALLGLIAGYAASLIFLAVQVAGQIADTEMGFGMVNVLDPVYGTPIPLMGSFLYLLALLIYMGIDGHHMALAAIVRSYEIIPAGKAVLSEALPTVILARIAEVFSFGVQLALPVIVSMFLATVAMGIVARAVPQINIFIMGMPIKMVLGAFVIGLSMPVFAGMAETAFRASTGWFGKVLNMLAP